MKGLFKASGVIVLTMIFVMGNAQTPAPELKYFAKGGLSFTYPADLTLEDKTASGGQNVVLTQGANGAQIMVLARLDRIDSPAQLAKARKEVFDVFVDSIVSEFQRQQAKIEHIEAQIEVGGSQATGVRLRAVLDGEPGNAEIYSLVLGRRFVIVTMIGSDKELSAATAAWGTVRRSLKVGEPATSSPAARAEVPDAGSVTGSSYANEYFGLTLTFPARWHVQDANARKQIAERGKKVVTSDNPAKKSELDRAVDSVLNLLTVSQFPVGEPGFNSMFLCGAENIPAGVRTDADYMSTLKNTLKYSQVSTTVDRDVHAEQIGGVAFTAIDFKSNYSGMTVNQKYYAHIMKNYALFFIMIYQTDEQLETQKEILRSAVLR